MEMDVNVFVDVEPEEADKVIWLIETLFEDWYVARFERQKRMSELKEIAQKKADQKKAIN